MSKEKTPQPVAREGGWTDRQKPCTHRTGSTSAVLWQVAASHVAVLRRASTNPAAPVLLTLFPPRSAPGQPRKGSVYHPATAAQILKCDSVHVEAVEADLRRRPGYSLGLIVNAADPCPPDWRPSTETGWAWGARNEHITTCGWLFSECDREGYDLQRQVELAAAVYDAEPSLVVATGGKSAHCYFRLVRSVTAQRFTVLQRLAIAAYLHLEPGCSADRSLSKPAQVLRLAGSRHPNSGRHAVIHSCSGTELCPDALEAHLTALLPLLPPPPSPHPRRPPGRSHGCNPTLRDIADALASHPPRVAGHGNYAEHRNLLWGLVKACEEAGGTIDTAISLMEAHSPSSSCGWDVRQVALSGGRDANPGWFWKQVGGHPSRRATR